MTTNLVLQKPLADPRLEEIAMQIFAFRYPHKVYTDPLFKLDVRECRSIALDVRNKYRDEQSWSIPSGQGVSEEWRQAYVASEMAKVLAELGARMPFLSLSHADRAWLRAQTEQIVEDAVVRFRPPLDNGSHYQPELEPEYEYESRDFDGRTESEKEA